MGWRRSVQVFVLSSTVTLAGAATNIIFVATKHLFFFSFFVATKMMLVAAPANDTTVASVGNGSIRAAVFIRGFGCLNVKKMNL